MADVLYTATAWWGRHLMCFYRATREFTVDGIVYPIHADTGGWTRVRSMIELIDDGPDDEPARVFLSDPPTDTELDFYVRHNVLPAT